jgi:predicted membrane channel-forming protein YqfA (hemolysin III family)
MSLPFYKILHLIGILMLFLSIGGAIIRAAIDQKNEKLEKFVLINHGTSLLIIVVAGFGMLAKLGMVFSTWVVVKIIIWLLMGALIMPIKKMPEKRTVWWVTALVLGSISAYMAIYKPF